MLYCSKKKNPAVVAELNGKLPKGLSKNKIDLSVHSATNPYTFDTDGIINVQSRYGDGNYASVMVLYNDGTNAYNVSVASKSNSGIAGMGIVFAGMKACYTGINGGATFIPFSS